MRKSQSETELVAAAVAGDSDAFGQLLFVHSPALEKHIRPRIPADMQRHLGVDDVLQDVFAPRLPRHPQLRSAVRRIVPGMAESASPTIA